MPNCQAYGRQQAALTRDLADHAESWPKLSAVVKPTKLGGSCGNRFRNLSNEG